MIFVSNFKNFQVTDIDIIIDSAINNKDAHLVLQHRFYTDFLTNHQIDKLINSTVENDMAWWVIHYSKAFSNFSLYQRDTLIDNVIKTNKARYALNSILNLKYLTATQIEKCVSNILYINTSDIEKLAFFKDNTYFYKKWNPSRDSVLKNFKLLTESQKERLIEEGLKNVYICHSLLTNTTCYTLSSEQTWKCINTLYQTDYEKICDAYRIDFLEKLSYLYKPNTDLDKVAIEDLITKILKSMIINSHRSAINILINERPKIIQTLSHKNLSFLVNYLCNIKNSDEVHISELFLESLPEDIAEDIIDARYRDELRFNSCRIYKSNSI